MRNPLAAPIEAEQFTRELHTAFLGNHEGFDQALMIARQKMDAGTRKPRSFAKVTSPEQALEVVKQALAEAQSGYAAALAPLTRREIGELTQNLYPVLCAQNREGHTLVDRYTGRRLCDLLEKMDRSALFSAADALAPLVDPELLKQLAALPEEGDVKVEGATGRILRKIATPGGNIVIGGQGKNTYDLDKMEDTSVVIDLGGDDVYLEGTASFSAARADHHRPGGQRQVPGDPARDPGRGGARGLDARGRRGQRHLHGPGRGPRVLPRGRGDPRGHGRQRPLRGTPPRPGACLGRPGDPPGPRRQGRLSRRDVGPGLRRPAGIRRARRSGGE